MVEGGTDNNLNSPCHLWRPMTTETGLLTLSMVLLGLTGGIIALFLVVKTISYGVGSALCAISLLPYLALILMSKKAASVLSSVYLLVLAFGFTTLGNYAYFEGVVLRPSGSSGDLFLIVPAIEFVLLLVFAVLLFRGGKSRRAAND
jgi:hypothetical protein